MCRERKRASSGSDGECCQGSASGNRSVLGSTLFGKSTALGGIFESSQPGNRFIYLDLSFSF
jgi:hypothetical protein